MSEKLICPRCRREFQRYPGITDEEILEVHARTHESQDLAKAQLLLEQWILHQNLVNNKSSDCFDVEELMKDTQLLLNQVARWRFGYG